MMPAVFEGERGTMRWFRSHIRGCARLALVALAVQLALTFGHVHLDGGAALASSQSAALTAAKHAAAPAAQARNQSPKSKGTADFDCPICALIQLASTSAPSVAPPVPVPAVVGGTVLETADESRPASALHFAFLARGPPAA
jgi:Protein of unknown function (DUF2946)